ncbi:glycoside hydrolase family 1 protein [Lacticaseibacillus pantheris]|jgi:6-phospho-beta-glucosidase|uniref:glycoside hydrolase family 1 protein n=1 Tax=Lacticaseibacillus pantheris TaxID=171523 RepID=UPI00265B1AD2|nr:glycoside hydrolase family 1 protein [Lacticaseibacillus pantheris]WKF85237.1 glycoside hydrolase family 1 protein [Lacticaseibacillus pantheris]
MKFPDGFVWGAASSGPQSEGNFKKQHQNIFDYWYATSPEDFYEDVGPDLASNFYNDYPEDLVLMRRAGIKALRLSIQWTRLIDDLETGSLNADGVEFYTKLFKKMHEVGVEPYVNLFHFDMPVELQHKYGGWQSKHVTDLFELYASQAFKLFGDLVDNWFTFNEPKVIIDGQYLYQFHYPNLVDGPASVQVAYNVNLASAKAIRQFRKIVTNKNATIGSILNLTPAYPASDSSADQKAAEIAELWCNEMFLQPAIHGTYPEKLVKLLDEAGVLWQSTDEEIQLLKDNTIDQLGVNYYHPFRVQAPDVSPKSLQDWMPDIYFKEYLMPGRVDNVDKGWEIYPKALYDIAINVRDHYDNIPWFVSENGMGVSREERFLDDKGVVHDDYRIDFMRDHLSELYRGIEAGSNCNGYFSWTAIDNWSWKNAFRNRYGLIRNEIHTQTKTIKKSGQWYNKLSSTNTLTEK